MFNPVQLSGDKEDVYFLGLVCLQLVGLNPGWVLYSSLGDSAQVSDPRSGVRRAGRGGRKLTPWLGVAMALRASLSTSYTLHCVEWSCLLS